LVSPDPSAARSLSWSVCTLLFIHSSVVVDHTHENVAVSRPEKRIEERHEKNVSAILFHFGLHLTNKAMD
jgi:hypothetical protein